MNKFPLYLFAAMLMLSGGAPAFGSGGEPALDPAELSPQKINQRIDQYRKAPLTVIVLDSEGKGMPLVAVQIEQQRHEFLFGCNIFELKPGNDSADQTEYQRRFTEIFNYATLPFYWSSFESEKDRPQNARLEGMAKWCTAHGITVKGHPLVWHEEYPAWAPADAEQTVPLLQKRVTEIISQFRNTIHIWDIVNEAVAGANYDPANGETKWLQRDGAGKVVETVLDWARCAAGKTPETLIYNDFLTGEQTLQMLHTLQTDQKLPDAIGIQSHMHQGNWPLVKLWQTCQQFSQFGKPLHFTEVTVLSGAPRTIDYKNPPSDWTSTPEQEKAQAEYVEQFYTLLFSHPSVQAITWWDLSDRNSFAGAPGGLLRKDNSTKAAYEVLRKLIKESWWTNSALTTDQNGQCSARVFCGDYVITAADIEGNSALAQVSVHCQSAKPAPVVTIRFK